MMRPTTLGKLEHWLGLIKAKYPEVTSKTPIRLVLEGEGHQYEADMNDMAVCSKLGKNSQPYLAFIHDRILEKEADDEDRA